MALARWANDPDLPLLVRKAQQNRGSIVLHESGRQLVPVDNSPAQWALSFALTLGPIDLATVKDLLAKDRIPTAMVFSKEERARARYRCSLGQSTDFNAKGWKLAHIKPVGLNRRAPIGTLPIEDVQEHFLRLMTPSNMFVVPKKWAGLAEVPEVLEAFARDAERAAIKV